MATFYRFFCKKCGLDVELPETTKYYLMSGAHLQCLCNKCHKLSSVAERELEETQLEELQCEECGATGSLSYWNPIEGRCPKCGEQLEEDRKRVVMYD